MANVIIVGGGVAGLAASLFTQKAGLETVVFDTGVSQIKRVENVHNYLGKVNTSGDQLIEQYRSQAQEVGVSLKDEEVQSIAKAGDVYEVKTASGVYQAKYVVIATNANTQLASDLGLEIIENEKIPNGRGKAVKGATWEGQTGLDNLFVAGLLAGIPSQAIISAGQGANVGVHIASIETGQTYMWHDVK